MYLKTKEVANKLGYTSRNIALLVKAGKLKPVNNHKKKNLKKKVQMSC